MKQFRQLTGKEKEEFQRNRDAYQEYLLKDAETIAIIESILGAGNYSGLNTIEKRALWRTGFEIRGRTVLFRTKDSNECLYWTALESGNVTDNDAFYYTLGQNLNRK